MPREEPTQRPSTVEQGIAINEIARGTRSTRPRSVLGGQGSRQIGTTSTAHSSRATPRTYLCGRPACAPDGAGQFIRTSRFDRWLFSIERAIWLIVVAVEEA
jgi:hypothetical protein